MTAGANGPHPPNTVHLAYSPLQGEGTPMWKDHLVPTIVHYKPLFNGVLEGIRFVDGVAQKPMPRWRAERFVKMMAPHGYIVEPVGPWGAPVDMMGPSGGEGHETPVLPVVDDDLLDRILEDEDAREEFVHAVTEPAPPPPVTAGATRGRKGK